MNMQTPIQTDTQTPAGPDDPVRKLVRARLESIGVSAKAASERIGRNHAYLQQFLERGVPRSLPEDAREALAPLLGVTPEDLRGPPDARGRPPMAGAARRVTRPFYETVAAAIDRAPVAAPVPDLHNLPHDVPVRGTARGDNDGKGDFTFNGEIAGYVRRLPGLAGVQNAFALYVQGSSMSPWREEGGLVYINPHRPPRIGDHVVVEMKPLADGEPGIVWIKKMIGRAPDGAVRLAQYNPPLDNIRIAAAKILRVFRVAEWEELIA